MKNLKAIVKAKEEIKRLRIRAETEIDDSNKLIERLRKQLGTDTSVDIESEILMNKMKKLKMQMQN